MNLHGIALGLSAFICIGVFHPIVILCEYHFSWKVWPVFLVIGIICMGISTHISDVLLSSVIGVFGFSCLWSIYELREQKKRVERGWFPENPKRKKDE